jgi:shikimate kinase
VKQLYKSRLPIYRSLGQRVITDSRTPQDIAAEILKKLAVH